MTTSISTHSTRQRRRWSLLPRRHAQNWEIYAGLLFLAFYFASDPAESPGAVAVTILSTLAFLILYFAAYWIAPPAAALPIAAIAAMGAALLAQHAGASVFLCYAASLACYLFPVRYGLSAAALILAAFLLLAGGAGYPEGYLAINSLVIVAVAAIHIQARRSTIITERLRLREAELASVHRASERRRIAHDLHDQLAQHLVLIALKADLARKQVVGDAASADRELSDIAEAARDTLGAVRRVVHGYSARPFDEQVRHSGELLRQASIDTVIDAQAPEPMSEREECFLTLILSEAVANVVRHAHAGRCTIRTAMVQGEFLLEVADDGRGAHRYKGFGTDGMRERAARLGGRLDIRRDGGTVVKLRVPLGTTA